MLEPIGKPTDVLEHHRRRAALAHEAGDRSAAYWHGCRAQAVARVVAERDEPERPLVAVGIGSFNLAPLEEFS